jgi:IS5 family transposase
MSSRVIEEATYSDVAERYIRGNNAHPDHSVICRFRRENKGYLKKVGNISVDGTKIHANGSKHRAVSYKRAGEMIGEAEQGVKELLEKAENADSRPPEDGLTIPEEIKRREERKGALEEAKRKMEKRDEEEATGKGSGENEGKKSGEKPLEEYQYNCTDPERRIMKVGNGKHFEQSYNAQAAVDTETMLVVGEYVTDHGNDKGELEPIVESIEKEVYNAETVSADTGFFSEEAVKEVEKRDERGERKGRRYTVR